MKELSSLDKKAVVLFQENYPELIYRNVSEFLFLGIYLIHIVFGYRFRLDSFEFQRRRPISIIELEYPQIYCPFGLK